MRSTLLLIVLSLTSQSALALTRADCLRLFPDLLKRQTTTRQSSIQEIIADFSDNPLINELEALHIFLVQSSPRPMGQGPLETKATFNLNWLFKDEFRTELDAILDHFNPEIQSRVSSVRDWVAKWEKAYVVHGGVVDKSWNQARRGTVNGRESFIKKIITELGYRHQKSSGAGKEPMLWTEEPDSDSSLNPLADPVIGSQRNFQSPYDKSHRRSEHSRSPRRPYVAQDRIRELLGQMKALGVSTRGFREAAPTKTAYESERNDDHHTQRLSQIIAQGYRSRIPLAGLFTESSGGSHFQIGLADSIYEHRRGRFTRNMAEVNERLPEDKQIKIGFGASNWASELLIQAALFYESELGHPVQFQATDPDEDYYLNPGSRIWIDSQLTLSRFNKLLRLR